MDNQMNFIDHGKKYFWLAAPYFVATGLLYLWSYWSSFSINILEFASLSDIVRVAIIPVGTTFFFFFLGFILSEYGYGNKLKLQPGEGKDTPVGKMLNKFKWFLIILYWVILLYLIYSSQPGKWRILPVWAMGAPYLMLRKSLFLEEIQNDSIRSLLLIGLVVLPVYSFCQGKIDAERILTNSEYLYVQTSTQNEVMKYIGHVNEMTFLISKDNRQIRMQKLDKESLDLFKFDSKKDLGHPNKPIQPIRKTSD
jgi:hypothetical protein